MTSMKVIWIGKEKMTRKELYLKLNELNTKDHAKLHISHRYICDLIDCSDGAGTYFYFTEAFKDKNSGARMSYADLNVYDTIDHKSYYGRLYRIVCDDLVEDSKYSYMLYLKEPQSTPLNDKDNIRWLTSLAISTDAIEIVSYMNDIVI